MTEELPTEHTEYTEESERSFLTTDCTDGHG